ncbi:MAG: L-seryl-tRNA(Sec) selenium transferase [Chloroflexi bacterium]|nr:L-seryl-tRNA(Sec) selenium transferase [Chloroflexota bacterium]
MQFRNLPSVDSVLANQDVAAAAQSYDRDWVVDLVREALESARERIRQGGDPPDVDQVATTVRRRIDDTMRAEPRQVINATGVVIHTNLGRAPLSRAAIEASNQAAQGYSNLELDLATGRRGSRQAQVQSLLRQLTGAEAALAVNNNASAMLLGLTALASGKEVVVSRSEAVEIGGGFRVPDVLRQSGATLVDVGTTNRTYVRDYDEAVTESTAAFLKVHTSNFRVEGFTASVDISDLVEVGQRRGIPVLHDVGSGSLLSTEKYGMAHEPTPQESIKDGAGLVFFSGDKLLGGPQAGIIVGKKDLVDLLTRHPLARAVRIDKMSLASLTATLAHYLKGEAEREIPVWRMIAMTEAALKKRAKSWQVGLECPSSVEKSRSTVGGGSLPGETLPSWVLSLDCQASGAEEVMRRLRAGSIPVIARIEEDRVLLDPRTVLPEEDGPLLDALRFAVAT